MRIHLLALTLLLVSGCAVQQCKPPPTLCPPLPTIGDNELLKDYVIKVVTIYNGCRK